MFHMQQGSSAYSAGAPRLPSRCTVPASLPGWPGLRSGSAPPPRWQAGQWNAASSHFRLMSCANHQRRWDWVVGPCVAMDRVTSRVPAATAGQG
jgi:hypothetical protein